MTEEEKITLIQSGAVHLKNISGSRIGNENISGAFCRLNWHIHKIDPASGKLKTMKRFRILA